MNVSARVGYVLYISSIVIYIH